MMRERVTMTLDGSGGGTVVSTRPVSGVVAEVRLVGSTSFLGTGTVTITRLVDGGTVLAGALGNGPWSRSPHQTVSTQTGGSVGADAPIPIDGYVQVVVAGGGAAAVGTVDVYAR